MSYEEVLLLHRVGGGVKVEALAAVVSRMFIKYWIYVCGTMFFFVSFEGKIVLYKVIYMVMFLSCVALYQVRPRRRRRCRRGSSELTAPLSLQLNYERWRALLRGFWVAVVVYSMLVLILIYTFQFPSSPHTWSYYSGLSTHRWARDPPQSKPRPPPSFTVSTCHVSQGWRTLDWRSSRFLSSSQRSSSLPPSCWYLSQSRLLL